MTIRNSLAWLTAATVLLATPACNDLTRVENPGSVLDEDLEGATAMPALVNGMSYDLTRAVDALIESSQVMGDDLYHGGSYGDVGLFNRGIIRREDVNGEWGAMHRGRWVAEQGIERLKRVLGQADYDRSPLAARANIYAGFANRLLGEHVCFAVFDGGPKEDFRQHFSRAEAQFTEALRISATLTGNLRDSLNRAAWGGRASVRAWQGKWAEAVADAMLVPNSYVFSAIFNTTDLDNNLFIETGGTRFEYTVFNTQWAQVFRDPRVPWDTSFTGNPPVIRVGQDGRTTFFRQRKLTSLSSDVALTKGPEMLMLRAEAALRAGNVDQAMTLINQQRAFYSTTANPLAPLSASSVEEAWPILQKERAAVLWLELRRFWDLRRWNAEPPPIKNSFLDNRDKCIPVSEDEENSNPNVRG